MKINISKTDEFIKDIDTVVVSLYERKNDLCNARKKLAVNSPTTDNIINHISETEKSIDETVYKLMMLKNAASRITEAFLNTEKLLEIKAEDWNSKKLPMPVHRGLIRIEVSEKLGELKING